MTVTQSSPTGDIRLGMVLDQADHAARIERARAADEAGVPAVLVSGPVGTEILRAAQVAAHTRWVRIAVVVHLSAEDPVTLAEEIAVLDNIAGGRIVVLTEGGTGAERELLRSALAGETVRGVTISPPPVQLQVPVQDAAWATGRFLRWDGDPADLLRQAAPPMVAALSAAFANPSEQAPPTP